MKAGCRISRFATPKGKCAVVFQTDGGFVLGFYKNESEIRTGRDGHRFLGGGVDSLIRVGRGTTDNLQLQQPVYNENPGP